MELIDVAAALARAAVTWEDLSWIRKHWPGPIVIKGLLTGDDARRAVDAARPQWWSRIMVDASSTASLLRCGRCPKWWLRLMVRSKC